MIPYERERGLDDASRIILECIARRGWTAETERFGDSLVTVKCTLRDAQGGLVSRGSGKGEFAASWTGAVYEAVEHYYCKASTLAEPAHFVTAAELADDPRCAGLAFRSEFVDQAQRRLACRRYASYSGRADLDVPLFMVFPDYPLAGDLRDARDDFDYRSAVRYSSNSGTAIGASFEEAALHGIGEIVERDAWSLFSLAHYLGAPAPYGRLLDPASLPGELARIHALAERRLDRSVLLIDMTSDLNYPAFLATTAERANGEIVFPQGRGASPYAAHAAIRALTELAQCVDIKDRAPHLVEMDQLALDLLEDYPKLRACVMGAIDPQRLQRASWHYAAGAWQTPQRLLPQVVADLEAHGIGLYHAINHREGEDFCVVSSASMELERFFLASSGLLMAPGRRGRDCLARQAQAARELSDAGRALEA